MEYQLPKLDFGLAALAPEISEETMQFHYGKHHKAYVDKVNALIKGTDFDGQSLEELILSSSGSLYNNAAQVWNHAFYWRCLTPHSNQSDLPGALKKAICAAFGSVEQFKRLFSDCAIQTFGSGWAWLVKDGESRLKIVSTSNGGNPLAGGLSPLLTCDVWEHAYYIDYRNARQSYVDAFWRITNWKFVSERLEDAGAFELTSTMWV